MWTQWTRKWHRPDNQEVGLEAAILERVRNSSLVQWFCAENVPGLKRRTEAADQGWRVTCSRGGRGALATAEKARRKAWLERGEVRMPE